MGSSVVITQYDVYNMTGESVTHTLFPCNKLLFAHPADSHICLQRAVFRSHKCQFVLRIRINTAISFIIHALSLSRITYASVLPTVLSTYCN